MSGRQGVCVCVCALHWLCIEVSLLLVGGKKKPLKQPKKQQQEMDEVK